MTSLNIHIPDNIAKRLDQLSAETGRTKSYYVREALEEKLETIEDYYFALQALERVETGKSHTWSQDDIEAERDLDD